MSAGAMSTGATTPTTPNEEIPQPSAASFAVMTSVRKSTSTNRLKGDDREVCKQKNEAEFLLALNSTVTVRGRGSTGEAPVSKVVRKRVKHPICDRVVVVIVVVGILFMMCTVLAALYLLLRILLSPSTQRNSPFGVAGYGNAHRNGAYQENSIEVKELIDKARRLLSSSMGTRYVQPRGRLKSLSFGVSATKPTAPPGLITSAASDSPT